MTRTWENMSKACHVCGTMNSPEEGQVTEDDLMILKYRCSKCRTGYQKRTRLTQSRVDALKGMSMKGQANDGGREPYRVG